ncbi:MAG: hypothetical protein P1Q69_14955 [Candidatus Thorarchaeota archaeon]|nr:hypothetical protein [Candidatus Thorarchaeota archaeon]
MKPELVDPIEWEKIGKHIDEEFGKGITKKLLGDLVPVVMANEKVRSFYLIPMKWVAILEEGFEGFDVRLLGLWLGDISSDKLQLSLPIQERLAPLTENILVVTKQAAQVFTYGKSVIREGVVHLKTSLKRKQRVIVQDREGNVLGLAMLVVDAFMRHQIGKDRLVARNLIDVGWYLRRMG